MCYQRTRIRAKTGGGILWKRREELNRPRNRATKLYLEYRTRAFAVSSHSFRKDGFKLLDS
jgi:hypothetical protein